MALRCASIAPPKKRPKTLKPVRPNAGVEAAYYKALVHEIDEMQRSLTYWLRARYRHVVPEVAEDASSFAELQEMVSRLTARWRLRFSDLAYGLADHFVRSAAGHTDAAMQRGIQQAGMTIKFKPSASVNRAIKASVNENVLLIKSIGETHLSQVGQLVQRAVQNGGDLGTLSKQLQERYGVTKRRAAFIANDQNAKATAAIRRQRQIDMGLYEAEWVHSAGGRHPRESHVKAGRDRLRFDIRKGAKIDGKFVQPGELPRCRCVCKMILPGFND